MERIFDLPAHPLLIHLPVVAIPVLALLATALAVLPAQRRRFMIPVVALSIISVIATFLAVSSGEALSELLSADSYIDTHRDLGNTLRWFVIGLALTSTAMVLLGSLGDASRLPPATGVVVSVVVVFFAVLSLIWVIRTGHEGAKQHWCPPGATVCTIDDVAAD